MAFWGEGDGYQALGAVCYHLPPNTYHLSVYGR